MLSGEIDRADLQPAGFSVRFRDLPMNFDLKGNFIRGNVYRKKNIYVKMK